ncbi:subunit of tubulin prefoldin [Tulasnella sp. 424]|nr:subunit of tubulin prefoldin [Tulasnella sp. 424]KAG8971111.1 subunit of tubulin prefoldin [Tulasnella sp. 425]
MSQTQVSVTDLDLPQLSEVKKQLDEELSHLSSSFAQLSKAQAKFKACIENVAEVNPNNKDKTILIPLTNSLYVPGKLKDPENVIIDVGTGYYVKKSRDDARKHYQKKADFVKSNLEKLQETIEKKQENMNFLLNVMQVKMAQQQRQGAAPSAS